MLVWNVLRHDCSRNEIEAYNVFLHSRFAGDVDRLKRRKLTRDDFSEELRRTAQYYFWSKCEMEVVVSSWPVYIDTGELNSVNVEFDKYQSKYGHKPFAMSIWPKGSSKIDIYDQLQLNWDEFADYCFENKM